MSQLLERVDALRVWASRRMRQIMTKQDNGVATPIDLHELCTLESVMRILKDDGKPQCTCPSYEVGSGGPIVTCSVCKKVTP